VAGDRRHAEALIAEAERAIAPLGLTLSKEKTRVAHIDEGIDFLGWRIQRHRGSNGRKYVFTYPSKRALASVKAKVKAITQTDHNQTLDQLVHRLNPVLRGWCAYFRPGVSSRTFNYLRAYTWQRVVRWLRRKHDKANWRWLRRRYLPGWWPTDGETVLFNPGGVGTTRYRYRGRGADQNRPRAQHRHPRMDRHLEPKPQTIRVDQDRRADPRLDRHLLRTNQCITTLGTCSGHTEHCRQPRRALAPDVFGARRRIV
jgi:Group II intron, maturase-specific domain